MLALEFLVFTPRASAQAVQRELAPVRNIAEKIQLGKEGARRTAEVRVQKWILDGRQTIEALDVPGVKGVRIVQLAAGEVTSVIRGERRERAAGEWWTVPAGETLGLILGNDSAILWVISVDPT